MLGKSGLSLEVQTFLWIYLFVFNFFFKAGKKITEMLYSPVILVLSPEDKSLKIYPGYFKKDWLHCYFF